MSAVYLAGRFSRRFQLQGVRADLQRAGHCGTSRWIDLREEVAADAAKCARIDIEDIEAADVLISFPDLPRSTNTRGGHFFEEGFALATGRRVIVVGYRSHIFHHLPEVAFFPTWSEALKALAPVHSRATKHPASTIFAMVIHLPRASRQPITFRVIG
jgi:nucleoside 2-deoxyribosyltransferase